MVEVITFLFAGYGVVSAVNDVREWYQRRQMVARNRAHVAELDLTIDDDHHDWEATVERLTDMAYYPQLTGNSAKSASTPAGTLDPEDIRGLPHLPRGAYVECEDECADVCNACWCIEWYGRTECKCDATDRQA